MGPKYIGAMTLTFLGHVTWLGLPVHGRVDYKITVVCYKAVKINYDKLRRPILFLCTLAKQTVARPDVIYLRPTVNTVFIDKPLLLVGSYAVPHRLEQSSLVCTHC